MFVCVLPVVLYYVFMFLLPWCKMYLIQHYVIKFVGDFRQVSVFFRELRLISTNKADRHDITEILLKVALKTLTPYPNRAVMFVTISAWKRCSVLLCPQLFVGELSYLLFVYWGVQHLLTIWETWRVSCKRQELFTLSSTRVHPSVLWDPCCWSLY